MAAIEFEAPGGTVTLRGLTIEGGGNIGININVPARVLIDRCIVSSAAFEGIKISTSAPLDIVIRDSVIERNEWAGLHIGAMDVNAVLNRVTVVGNGGAFLRSGIAYQPQAAGASIALAVRASVLAYNGDSGLAGGQRLDVLGHTAGAGMLIVGDDRYGIDSSWGGAVSPLSAATSPKTQQAESVAALGATVAAAGNAVSRDRGARFVATDVGTIFFVRQHRALRQQRRRRADDGFYHGCSSAMIATGSHRQ